MPSRSSVISHQEWENIELKTDNHIPLVVPGVQATEHQTKALDDRKNGFNHSRKDVDKGIYKFDRRISSCRVNTSTGTSSFRASSAKPTSNKAGRKHNLFTHFPRTRIAKSADARKLRKRHAKEILSIGRTEFKLPNNLGL